MARMARSPSLVYVVGVSANLTVKQLRPMQVPRSSKALAFGHQVRLRGALAIMHNDLLLTPVWLYKIQDLFFILNAPSLR